MVINVLMVQTGTALEISEVEQNPDGDDTGNEWVELYSETTVNLEGYYLTNKAKKRYNLTGEFSGYIAIIINTSSSGWITNKNDSITLWNDEEVDKTPWLEEEKEKKEFAWSKCSGEWILVLSTKGEENACERDNADNGDEETDNNESDTGNDDGDSNTNSDNSTEEESDGEDEDVEDISKSQSSQETKVVSLSEKSDSKTSSSKKEKIVLNQAPAAPIASEKSIISREGIVQQTVIYAFAGFCVLLIVLLSLRKV